MRLCRVEKRRFGYHFVGFGGFFYFFYFYIYFDSIPNTHMTRFEPISRTASCHDLSFDPLSSVRYMLRLSLVRLFT